MKHLVAAASDQAYTVYVQYIRNTISHKQAHILFIIMSYMYLGTYATYHDMLDRLVTNVGVPKVRDFVVQLKWCVETNRTIAVIQLEHILITS